MKRFVVGASVAMKWFVPERYSEEAAKWLERDVELFSPDLTVVEIGALLFEKTQKEEISVREARDILAAFGSVPMKIVPSSDYLELAFEVAEDLSLDFYDCIYFAVGMRLGCPVLTADRQLYETLKDGPYSKNIAWVDESGGPDSGG